MNELKSYRLLKEKKIEELNSLGMILEHKKTGARLFLLSNDDDNKVFNIGFKTPPANNTGVAHIMEHSVLCGSAKFPVKDPFVELVKGSLNTFLNAMTYPDKTVYPVASRNDTDFKNLMNVYLDAVFHPNIYHEKKIFCQEGWHYEMESENDKLHYNGVVYNEMKGVYSSPESVLEQYNQQILFPDNCYGFESGGNPDYIPDLSYEEFLEFHKTYYHPSNSYIYLYGDMDMEQTLIWLDEEYLSHYEKINISSEIKLQQPFLEPVERETRYSITEEETEENASYLSLSTVVGTDLDPDLYIAFQILEYTLIDAPGAPLKQALVDAGIGQDIMGGYENGILQPYFSVIAKNADAKKATEFKLVVKGTLKKLADRGIDKRSLKAGLNYYEFKYREADYGSAPKGLMYGLMSLDSWLYGGDPMMHLCYQQVFDRLKKAVDDGYFENLLTKYLLDNPHEAFVVVNPKKNMTIEKEKELEEKLKKLRETMSKKERAQIVEDTRLLKEYQSTESSQEELEKIPLLKRSDIGREAEKILWKKTDVDGITVLHHDMFTSGIGYLRVLFNTEGLSEEELKYAGLLKSVLGYVNTEHFDYADLSSEILLNSGGLDFSVSSYVNLSDPEKYTGAFTASIRVLYDKLDFGFAIIKEILTTSVLNDEKRLQEIIGEVKSRGRMKIESAGHSAAVSRGTSYFSATAYYNELTAGIAYYKFLEKLAKDYDSKKAEIVHQLEMLSEKLFVTDRMLISYCADAKGFAMLPSSMKKLTSGLGRSGAEVKKNLIMHPVKNLNEGFKTSSQVNYVARCGNFRTKGFSYTGALRILKVILSYDYLWIQVRVKGGAYGCMSGFGRSGEGYLVSYRDPHVRETNEIYKGIVEYLENFHVSERDMTKFVIGTVSDLDAPMTPAICARRGLSAYLSGVTDEMMQKEREEVLNASEEDIRNLAPILRAILDMDSICVIGNEKQITGCSELFGEIKNLFE